VPGLKDILLRPLRLVNSSLRFKLLSIFVILTTIPLGIVGVVSYSRSFSTIQQNITDSATQLASQLNKSLELVFRESERFLKIGSHETTIRFVNPYRQSEEGTYRAALEIIGLFKLFREIYEFDTQIRGIYILGFNGNNISEAEGRFRLEGELSALPTVRRILARPGEIAFIPNSQIDYSPSRPHRDVVSVGRAIVRPSTRDLMGVIVVEVDRAAIRELCRTVRMGETGYFAVVTPQGEFIYPPGADSREVEPANLRRIASTQEGHFVQAVGREPEFFVFNTLPVSGWKIVGRVKLRELMRGAYQIRSLTLAVMALCLLFTVVLYFFISDALTHPIRELREKMAQAESGNLEVQAERGTTDEIAGLYHSFNVMIGKIRELLQRSIEEQEQLAKSELKALQAQINPHFLYNTLDAIVWMTEANRRSEVVRMTKTLSTFFRVVLSKGEEWIRVREEFEHVESYLAIQKMRYRDILDYDIQLADGLGNCRILKLTLQPLVENAIYHGIKAKRQGGRVRVAGRRLEGERLEFEVSDDGGGMPAERLAQVRAALEQDLFQVARESGFGLRNVNQRIRLYYGRQWGVRIESGPGSGTRVTVLLPAVS
jgi:two-component system sensor histidine kinase YesM